ncbi:autotransporter outer membrane beta-barrel domain-containing protein [Ralstonia solanacearum]|uniref:Autotransporter outer membrane beta-barrel domain-containing protein n=1 Tax=Ralstonia solanacearum TaxID=305 RepID=A0AAD0SD28_RALSL|nr:autotransporter domain-containing protein [Ralstonia solanacearum]AXV84354.1 autotransporter outer membrane beta-barrel domain-containing protein [Ralstonia solanacearum]AXW55487.1 autotransporter outer membrane beta-barrel domain-containing protein [Ralstonia solanacearum]
MNQHAHHRPRQTALTLAVAAALAAMAQMQTAAAVTATVSSPIGGTYIWSSGDLSVTSTISGGGIGVAAFAIGTLGTLSNSGVISGGYGFYTSGTVTALNNASGGTISATGNDGVFNTSNSTIGTLTNDGAISGAHFGVLNYYAATINTLTNSGAITGGVGSVGVSSWAGIDNAGSIGTLTNTSTGTISATGNAFGVYNTYMIDTLSNSGLITADSRGILNNGTITTLINNRGGTISHSGSAFGDGIDNGGTIGTLTNSGVISAAGSTGYGNGIDNSGTITTLTNNSGGTIAGNYTGLYNSDTIGTLTNHGAIIGGYSAGIANDGTIGTLTNSGVITGSNSYSGSDGFGVKNSGTITSLTNASGGTISGTVSGSGAAYGVFNGGTIGSLVNSGLITGSTYALYNDTGSTLGPVTNAGVIAGNIRNLSSSNLSISGGTGTTFGTLTGYGGGSTLGTIDNPNSNVVFASGNLLLNDNVNLGTGTINAVNNTGSAVVQVNQPVTITGNYNQGSGATLQIGVASGATTQGTLGTDAGYGRLVVTGNTTIASGSSITLQSNGYAFAAGQRYVVVDTAGTAAYNAGSLRYAINGYASTVTGAAVANGSKSDLVLTVVSATSLSLPATPSPTTTTSTTTTPNPASIATAPNAVASLNGLLGYTGISSPTLLNLYNAALGSLSEGSTAGANQIGKQLGATQTGWAPAAPTFDALNVVGAHVNTLRLAQAAGTTGVATGDSPAQWGVWGQAFGGHAQQSEREQIDGYRANYGGLLIGADREINDQWRAGGVFSYSNTSIDNTGDASGNATRVNGYGLIGYASYTGNPWYVNLSGAAVQQQYDTSRVVSMQGFSGTASGHFSGQQYVARTEAGYPLPVGSATLTPLASLTYSHLTQDSYAESGGNGAALSVGSTHVSSVKSGLGAKLEKGFATRYGQIVLEARAQWIHEYNHAKQVTGASFAADATGQTAFTTVGMTPVSDLADISLGATLLRANNLSLSARYELQAGRGFVSQTGSVRLRQLF